MNSELLNKFGLNSIDPAYFIIALLIICVLLLTYVTFVNVKLNKLTKKYDRFMRGKDAETLEDVIYKRFEEVDLLLKNDKEKEKLLKSVFESLKITISKVGVVKYDAFNEMGGKLSFALAMLNQENTGFVMNAMHSREGCYIYIKEIIKGESYIPLGGEEREALSKAMEQ